MFVPAAAVPIFIFSTLNFRKKHEISLSLLPRHRNRFAFNIIVAHLWEMKTPAIAVSNPHFHTYISEYMWTFKSMAAMAGGGMRNMLAIDATFSVCFVNTKICSRILFFLPDYQWKNILQTFAFYDSIRMHIKWMENVSIIWERKRLERKTWVNI